MIAYRLKAAAVGSVPQPQVVASSSSWPKRPEAAVDGRTATLWFSDERKRAPWISAKNPEWLQLTFAEPVALGGIKIIPYSRCEPKQGEWQISQDGQDFQPIQSFAVDKKGPIALAFPEVKGRYFRLLVREAFGSTPEEVRAVAVADLVLLDKDGRSLDMGKVCPPVESFEAKAMYTEGANSTINDRLPFYPGEEDVLAKDVIDLTGQFDKDGTLHWDVPEGTWQVFRFGCTVTDGHVSFSSGQRPGWNGQVLDYLDPSALESYWREVVDPLLAEIRQFGRRRNQLDGPDARRVSQASRL